MLADPEIVADQGGPVDAAASDTKRLRYAAAYDEHGFTRWPVEDRRGRFLGYTGVMPGLAGYPLGARYEIGWRFVRSAWGYSYATEAAAVALADVFARSSIQEVLAYTSPGNLRSQAVMVRLGLQRAQDRDFVSHAGGRAWPGLVWVARRP